MRRTLRTTLALALSTTSLTAVGVATAPSSFAVCAVDGTSDSTPNLGRKVWIPTSDFSAWKGEGRIIRHESDADSVSNTVGSVHNVSVEGKAGSKIGPVGVEVTAKYNYTHSKSTTTKTRVERGWSYEFKVPDNDSIYRARNYKLGWMFKYKRTIYYTNGCDPQVRWFFGAAPVKRNTGVYYWALERYENRGNFRYDGL
jgi:hypothetical protein